MSDGSETGNDNSDEHGAVEKKPTFWMVKWLRPIWRTVVALFAFTSIAGAVDFLLQRFQFAGLSVQPPLHFLSFFALFIVMVIVAAFIDSEERHFLRSNGSEGFNPKASVFGISFPTKSITVLMFGIGIVGIYMIPYIWRPVVTITQVSPAKVPFDAVNVSSPAPSHAPRQSPASIDGHVVTSVTIDSPGHLCDGNLTTLQCDSRKSAYGTKWVEWSGTISDITPEGINVSVPDPESYDNKTDITVNLRDDELNHLSTFRVNDRVKVFGEMDYAYTGMLENARVLKDYTADGITR